MFALKFIRNDEQQSKGGNDWWRKLGYGTCKSSY